MRCATASFKQDLWLNLVVFIVGDPLCRPISIRQGRTKWTTKWTTKWRTTECSHQMAQLIAFGFQVFGVVTVWFDANGDLLDDFQAIAFQAHHFLWVISEEADRFQPEINQDLRAETILAQVHFET